MPRRSRRTGISFSWRRATGLSAAKARLSRQIGIPLTRSGRQRKAARALGCCVPVALLLAASYATAAALFR